jgi:hypothetical protein
MQFMGRINMFTQLNNVQVERTFGSRAAKFEPSIMRGRRRVSDSGWRRGRVQRH